MKHKSESSKRFHGVIAYSKQWKHEINLLNSNGVILVIVIESDGRNHENREHQQRDIVKSDVSVEERVVCVLLDEQVIVFFDQYFFPADQPSWFHFRKKLIV